MHAQQAELITSKLQSDIKLEDLVLPSPPKILQAICELQNNPHQNVDNVVVLLSESQVIQERLIQLANCVMYRGMLEIKSVKPAILRLGISRVLSLISGMSISQYISITRSPSLEKHFTKMWLQCLDVASIAYVIAQLKTQIDSEKALLAGMVHNIGVLPLLLSLDNTPVFKQNPTIMRDMVDAIIPKYYPYAGRILMQSWNLPEDIISIATNHRNLHPPTHKEIELCDVIQLAFALSKTADYTNPDYEPIEVITCPSFTKFWGNWNSAAEELATFEEHIKLVRNIIAI